LNNTVIELFAGVGGFRLGLEKSGWEINWSNQWEPNKKVQHAFNCYTNNFEKGVHSNLDISTVEADKIPDHTLLVGGFPCQDYSVASTNAKGLQGKKGVLFWEIERIVKEKKPSFILLENVDRLLKSPSKQRGRDFGIILSALNNLGYGVEWRVVNAADYGFAQKRRRVFIFAFSKETTYYKNLIKLKTDDIVSTDGYFASTFPVLDKDNDKHKPASTTLDNDLVKMTNTFDFKFLNSGIMLDLEVYTKETIPDKVPFTPLEKIIETGDIDEAFFIKDVDLPKWKEMKGAKSIERTSKTGFTYVFSEGNMNFPDRLDQPGRTILTSEGKKNRSSHAIKDFKTGRLRILTPKECERLNGFPDDWTKGHMPENSRYFVMGNALVVDLVEQMGERLHEILIREKS
jgi:DNA (cytosine-5)-methyltransferase 1